jgi:hypothetical protein
MKITNLLKKHWIFCAVLLVAALARLVYLFDWHEIWWDSGVYIGMAKYLWSGGSAGLWEQIRPILWPLFLGAAWWLKLNIVLFARIAEFVLSIVSIALVYLLAKKYFSQRAAIISSIIWAFSSIVFYLGFHEYTEIPEVTLVLAAVLAFSNSRWFLSGILAGLAFLTKFPAGIFIAVLGICIILQKRWKPLVPLGAGFLIPTAAFLAFNQAVYGTMLGPVIEAHKSILQVVGCNILRYKPWYQYFIWIFSDNVLNIFSIFGIAAIAGKWDRKYFLPVLALVLPLAHLMQQHCRDYRYLVVLLPFVVIFSGYGISIAVEWLEKKRKLSKFAWPAVLVAVLIISSSQAIIFYKDNEQKLPDFAAENYFKWLKENNVEGEIWSANPVISAYTDRKVNKIYYPIYGQETATDFNKYLNANSARIGAVLLDNCGGGLVCSPDDQKCPVELEKMRAFLNERFRQVLFEQSGRCWYSIYIH